MVYANDAAARALGFASAHELLHASPNEVMSRCEIVDEDGAPFPADNLPEGLALQGMASPETVIGLRDESTGELRWSVTKARPVFDADGRVRLAVNIFRDITDARRAEAERMEALQVAQAARSEAEGSAENLWAINQVTDVALSHLALDELLDELLTRIRDALDVDTAAILLITTEGDQLAMRATSGWDASIEDVRFPVAEGILGRIAAERRPLVAEQLTEEDAPPDLLGNSGVVSLAGVPLILEERLFGVLQVGSRSVRAFDQREQGLLQLVADRIAYSIDRARLFDAEHRAREQAEFALDRIGRLLAVTAALSQAVTPAEVSHVIIDQGLAAMGARAGALSLLGAAGTELESTDSIGYTETQMRRWRRFSVDADAPLAQAVRERQLVLIPTRAELAKLYPHLSARNGHKSFAAIPLLTEGRAIGSLGLSFDHPAEFSAVERAFMLTLGQQCAQALERARLYEAAQSSRARAERAADRIAFLAEAGEVLGASLDFRDTLARVARLAVPRLSDWCVIEMTEDQGSVERLTIAAVSHERAERARELRRRYPPIPDAPSGPTAVLRTGEPEIYPEITAELLRASARDPEHLRLLEELDLRSAMIVPLKLRGRVLGVITFASSRAQRFDNEDLLFAESLARRAAASIDNALLYREMEESRERFAYLARTLQRSLLPQTIAEVPGVEAAVRYRAAAEGSQVGGDFYDLFPTADGRWAIVVGDVCGKGARAAALTGLARHTIRSVAMLEADPRLILARLNDAIMREGEDDHAPQFCTVAYATLEADNGGARLRVSSGGHPLPLVLRSDGSVVKAGTPGLLLGVFRDPEVTEHDLELGPGDAVLFYTDGVTEGRRAGQAFGEARLTELLASCAGCDAEGIVETVERAVIEFSPERRSDDIAVLALRVTP